MTSMDSGSRIFDYLQVDSFLKTLIDAKTLETAIAIGLIDDLKAYPGQRREEITQRIDGNEAGIGVLCKLLAQNGVVEEIDGRIQLSKKFQKILPYFPLLRAKIEFAGYAVHDFSNRFADFIQNTENLHREARIFDLFGYNRCWEDTDDNRAKTAAWVRLTTALTRYEAPVCMHFHDFSPYRRLLDIGGNSGEFARQVCQRFPAIRAVVFDLPVVCEIGRRHLHRNPEAERIEFIPGSAFVDPLPTGFDLIVFKSMLHDWPASDAGILLEKAAASITSGGTILIFERGPLEHGRTDVTHAALPFLLFFQSFRTPSVYQDQLRQLGFHDFQIQWIDLETPAFLLTARKKGKRK